MCLESYSLKQRITDAWLDRFLGKKRFEDSQVDGRENEIAPSL